MPPARAILVRLYRAALIACIAVLLYQQAQWLESRRGARITVAQARQFFPDAEQVQLRGGEKGTHYALNRDGDVLGALVRTSPESDDIIGYSGPNDVLVAIDRTGAVAGIELLRSGDTPEHVDLVQRDSAFVNAFNGWIPRQSGPPKVSAVAGATLTSYAIAEAVQKRLAGAGPSLRFPEPIALSEVQLLVTNAASVEPDGRRMRVLDTTGALIAFVTRTSPEADNVAGYRGPSEALVALAPDGKTIKTVRLRKSYDTPSYADQIRDDEIFLKLFEGRTMEQVAELDYKREKVEGVSGATMTSFAIAEGLKRRFGNELRAGVAKASRWKPKARDWALAGVLVGALVMSFTWVRGNRWIRITWQAVLIGYVGLISGDLLSLALFGGWASSGLAVKAAPGLVLLGAAALIIPWATRRQLYCHQICPHGAAQEWLGAIGKRFRRRKPVSPLVTPHPSLLTRLEYLPVVLLLVALVALVSGLPINLAMLEPFDAWIWRAATTGTIAIAVIGLAASFFVPQAYCRFGCPTGALLNFLRSTGSGDRWSRRDTVALAFLVAGISAAAMARAAAHKPPAKDLAKFHGRTMGTTWTVKIRERVADAAAVQRSIAHEFEVVEQLTSHWRTNTELSIFNRSMSTDTQRLPAPVVHLVEQSAEISRATGGAFDVTVGALMPVWGFGPGPRRDSPPEEEEIEAARAAVGWEKLELIEGEVRKKQPKLQLDLSAIAPGWAVDRVAEMLAHRGYTNFLVESGGELRACGVWTIAIEHPVRSFTLSNESIGTSGTYRQNWKQSGRTYSHLLDPRTGRPIEHNTVSVSVLHNDCAEADAWAAALNVLGVEEGLPLAEKFSLPAQFVVENENQQLELRQTTRWPR